MFVYIYFLSKDFLPFSSLFLPLAPFLPFSFSPSLPPFLKPNLSFLQLKLLGIQPIYIKNTPICTKPNLFIYSPTLLSLFTISLVDSIVLVHLLLQSDLEVVFSFSSFPCSSDSDSHKSISTSFIKLVLWVTYNSVNHFRFHVAGWGRYILPVFGKMFFVCCLLVLYLIFHSKFSIRFEFPEGSFCFNRTSSYYEFLIVVIFIFFFGLEREEKLPLPLPLPLPLHPFPSLIDFPV